MKGYQIKKNGDTFRFVRYAPEPDDRDINNIAPLSRDEVSGLLRCYRLMIDKWDKSASFEKWMMTKATIHSCRIFLQKIGTITEDGLSRQFWLFKTKTGEWKEYIEDDDIEGEIY